MDNLNKNKKVLLQVYFNALHIALVREPSVKLFFTKHEANYANSLSANTLLKKLKSLLSLCGLRTINTMFKKNVFKNEKTVLSIVGNILKRRNIRKNGLFSQILLRCTAASGKLLLFQLF